MPHAPGPRPRRRAALAAIALAPVLAQAADAAAADAPHPGPVVAPAAPGESWLAPALAPGARWSAPVVVTNTAPVPRRLRLYAVDAALVAGGAFAPGPAGERRRAGRWIRPGVRALALGAGESAHVPVRVRVPASAPGGTHLGAVVAEDAGSTAAQGIRVVTRSALRVYVRVSPPARARGEWATPATRASYFLPSSAALSRSALSGRPK